MLPLTDVTNRVEESSRSIRSMTSSDTSKSSLQTKSSDKKLKAPSPDYKNNKPEELHPMKLEELNTIKDALGASIENMTNIPTSLPNSPTKSKTSPKIPQRSKASSNLLAAQSQFVLPFMQKNMSNSFPNSVPLANQNFLLPSASHSDHSSNMAAVSAFLYSQNSCFPCTPPSSPPYSSTILSKLQPFPQTQPILPLIAGAESNSPNLYPHPQQTIPLNLSFEQNFSQRRWSSPDLRRLKNLKNEKVLESELVQHRSLPCLLSTLRDPAVDQFSRNFKLGGFSNRGHGSVNVEELSCLSCGARFSVMAKLVEHLYEHVVQGIYAAQWLMNAMNYFSNID